MKEHHTSDILKDTADLTHYTELLSNDKLLI